MAFGAFPTWGGTGSVGTDLHQLTITNDQDGSSVTLDGPLFRLEEEDESHLLKGAGLDNGGKPWHRVLAYGWRGTVEVERMGSQFGQLYAFLEAQFYNGQPQATYTMTMTQLDTGGDSSGNESRFQHRGVVFHGYKPGTWERENVVKPSVQWASAERITL